MQRTLKYKMYNPLWYDLNYKYKFNEYVTKYYIYLLKLGNVEYIGQTKDLQRRLKEHKTCYKNAWYEITSRKSHNGRCSLYYELIDIALNPSYWDAFLTVEVLAVTNNKQHANALENKFMTRYHTINKMKNKDCANYKIALQYN